MGCLKLIPNKMSLDFNHPCYLLIGLPAYRKLRMELVFTDYHQCKKSALLLCN